MRIITLSQKQAERIKTFKQDYENYLIKKHNIKYPLMSGGYANEKSFLANIFYKLNKIK